MRCILFPVIIVALSGTAGSLCSAPAPQEKKLAVQAQTLRALLGKDHRSKEMQKFREFLGDDPVASYRLDFGICIFYHSWRSKGIEMRFEADNTLRSIFLYAGKTERFQRYEGELPEKLEFQDTPAVVEKKLGKPTEVIAGSDRVNVCWTYPSKGLNVEFNTTDPEKRDATVAHITMYPPEEKK